mmetsp:Transcript_58387/g.130120  ORF Transcript_58387/g.130120 Transcript_58387/m.130120 type:complete len:260 (-) Transcript_58387:260-1039(-)
MGRSDVKRVAIRRIAGDFAIDARATSQCMLLRLQEEHACPLAHHKPSTACVERSAGGLRGIVAIGAHRTHASETRKSQRSDRRFRPPGEHDIRLPELDVLERLTERMRPCRARAHHAKIGSFGAKLDGNHRSCGVPDDGRQQERRDAFGALGEQYPAALLHCFKAANARANKHTKTFCVDRTCVERTICHCTLRSGHRKVRVAIVPPRLLFRPILRHVEIPDFARDFDLRLRRIKECDWANTTFSLEQVVKEGLCVVAE